MFKTHLVSVYIYRNHSYCGKGMWIDKARMGHVLEATITPIRYIKNEFLK